MSAVHIMQSSILMVVFKQTIQYNYKRSQGVVILLHPFAPSKQTRLFIIIGREGLG